MTPDHDKHDVDAVAQVDAAEETDEDGSQYVMQGIITVALFGGFIAFALFCLPFYIFN